MSARQILMAEDYAECPVCQCRLSILLLERHVNSHLDDDDDEKDWALACQLAFTPQSPLKEANDSAMTTVKYPKCCKQDVPLQEWESHCLIHQLKADEPESWTRNSGGCIAEGSTSGRGRNALVEAEMQVLLATQKKGFFTPIEEGISSLLKTCLEAEQQNLSCAAISGYIDHFQTCASEDFGWGCGWRNIQMLGSHLLVQNWGARNVLFGGAGFVPDITSLQRWLEIAWHQEFDLPGADWYHGKIHGSKEWIGTTECAALFRSFGLRARIVDFSNTSSTSDKSGQHSIKRWFQESNKSCQVQRTQLADMPVNVSIHHNVQCDLCGVYPIRGTRFRSIKIDDYDLCFTCMSSSGQPLDHFEQIELPSNTDAWGKRKGLASDEDINHHSLVNWVWDYFTSGEEEVSSRVRVERLHGRIITSGRTPLYFQHHGHSRTIVGMQRRKKSFSAHEEVFLLVLDPAICTSDLARSLRGKAGWQRLIKRGIHTLKKREYQICYVDPGIAHGEELEQLKVLSSETHQY